MSPPVSRALFLNPGRYVRAGPAAQTLEKAKGVEVLMESPNPKTPDSDARAGPGAQTLEKAKGVEVLTEACAACKAAIDKRKGRLVIKEAARAVRASGARPCSLLHARGLESGAWDRAGGRQLV